MIWGYSKHNGPHVWSKEFPIAAGRHQSPIDIKMDTVVEDLKLGPLAISYDYVKLGELSNTGSSWKAQVKGGKSVLTGGPLKSSFSLEQFHCHWGGSSVFGSEHSVNGSTFAGELHLVHWDSEKFKSFDEAAAIKGGLTVLGILLKEGKAHSEIEKITKLLKYIIHKGQTISLIEKIDPIKLLPESKSYWAYDGSLTTPPCYESVNWILFQEAVEVSKEQLNAMRKMMSYHPCEVQPCDELKGGLFDNYRPPCPINDRKRKNARLSL